MARASVRAMKVCPGCTSRVAYALHQRRRSAMSFAHIFALMLRDAACKCVAALFRASQ